MNTELKLLLDLAFDLLSLGQDAMAKKNFLLLLPGLWSVAADIPEIVKHWDGLKAELQALPGSEQEKDLIAFIEQKFSENVLGPKGKMILSAVLKLIEDVVVDAVAVKALIKKV